MLRFEAASCTRGKRNVLSGFSYDFSRGDRIGLVGPNGAGKSSFLLAVLQQLPLEGGRVVAGETVLPRRSRDYPGWAETSRDVAVRPHGCCPQGVCVRLVLSPRRRIRPVPVAAARWCTGTTRRRACRWTTARSGCSPSCARRWRTGTRRSAAREAGWAATRRSGARGSCSASSSSRSIGGRPPSGGCRAESGGGCSCCLCSPRSRTCFCSTSRRTTSTSTRSPCWRSRSPSERVAAARFS